MTFKIDYVDGDVLEWSITGEGADCTRVTDYTPTIYVSGDGTAHLDGIRPHVDDRPGVVRTAVVEQRTRWRADPEPVLAVDLDGIDRVTDVAHEIRSWGDPGEYRLYNVDFSREFRYCLENSVVPSPDCEPTTCSIEATPKQVSDGEVTPLEVGGETLTGDTASVLGQLQTRLADVDPDVLVLSTADLVPLLYRTADAAGVPEFELGREPGFQQLAGESTFESYGRVGHSPARYNVPGRAIIDGANTFFWNQTNLDGLFDLVGRSWKPIQELAWASIGNVLTGIQIREARTRDVLVPWKSWRHEQFKSMATLHDADRGGFIFAPKVGVHRDVHELDFASLYPNIIVTRNVSPDKIRCDCHGDRADVPGLGYSICDEQGYLVDVLRPLIEDREDYKAALRETDDPDRAAALRGQSEAIKWILVSCFGYQGFSNAKFGRIECHEAINEFAREILLDSKAHLEANGWEVIHGIVDSLWVKPIPDQPQAPLEDLAAEITADVGITLDYEGAYDWIAFVPRTDSDAGALNRYFGKRAGADEFKKRGIELRQRSTPPFIERCQQALLEVLDAHLEPEPVCDKLETQIATVQRGEVDPNDLLIRTRVSKRPEEYSQYTRNVAALERAGGFDFEVQPGEDVRYVVVDDDKASRDRVQLEFEELSDYDPAFYTDLLVRAAESLLSPMGWDASDIRQYLAEHRDASLTAFAE